MNEQNLLVFTIYIIIVLYVFYRAVKSVEEKVVIKFNQEFIKEQLEIQNLQNVINVNFKLAKEYKLDELRELNINLENKTEKDILYIDWDRSVITDFNGRSRRVIRIVPGMTLDLFQPQVYSVITAGKNLKEKFTAEDVLNRESDSEVLKVSLPLFDLNKLKKGSNNEKKLYNEFITRTNPLQFSLQLLIWVFEAAKGRSSDRVHIIYCNFTVQKMHWTEAISWKPEKNNSNEN